MQERVTSILRTDPAVRKKIVITDLKINEIVIKTLKITVNNDQYSNN
jgi:hypothetical protein